MRQWAALAAFAGGAALAAEGTVDDDPYGWLEDVTGERALAWVAARNAESTAELTAAPGYAALHARLLSILDSKERIPYVGKMGDGYYNFWQDADHVRGIWRRTTLDEFRKPEPTWETVIDLDALSASEGKSWVFHGGNCLEPEYRRCLVSLSDGGSDASVVREFDTVDKAFVAGGFGLPEGKSHLAWVDVDTVLVSADFGEGTTTSGYPRQVREWRRGSPLSAAPLVFEGQTTDVSVSGYADTTPGFEREFVHRSMTFFTSETWLRRPDGALVHLDVPADAHLSTHRQWLLVELRTDWEIGGRTWPGGSLLVTRFDDFLNGDRAFQALFTPTEHTALAGTAATREAFVVNELDDVHNRLYTWTFVDGTWRRSPLPGMPEQSTLAASAVDPDGSDDLWLTVTDYLTPTTLSLTSAGEGGIHVVKALPALFDASGLEVTQHFATSDDGTKIPYFQVSRAGMKLNGKTPTLLYGYGGFEISQVPAYSASVGAAWLERGGTYVVANIRGGGEYGPRWHQAALKQERHKAYEDFAAVARDLIARKVTSPKHLGAMGGSNGGLLVGNMLVQYPQLFGAIVCQVPLLDMKRYSHLLAGASWIGEYGDPDDPEQWKYIQTFSPYHLVRADQRYPRTLFVTSTRDDRVHPGHARKMAAKMLDQGHDVLYWENTEGGHGAAATNAERATMWALSWTFLARELGLR